MKNNSGNFLLIVVVHGEHHQCHHDTTHQKMRYMHKKTMLTFNSFKAIISKRDS